MIINISIVTRRLGHEFCHNGKMPEAYCEQCLRVCWPSHGVAKCQNCGFYIHEKCIPLLSRRCQGQGGAYLMQIAPEVGLSAQKYKCKECRVKIAINPNEAKLGTLEAVSDNFIAL